MGKHAKGKTTRGTRNDSRPNGKAFKQNPGEPASRNTGRSDARRAERRAHLQGGAS